MIGDGVCFHPGQCVSYHVESAFNMPDVRGELGDIVQVSCLSRRVTVALGVESIGV